MNINKIKLSGTTYNIQDLSAAKTVELTQAQYDALTVKDPNTFYIITDAQGADLSQYYTSAQTESAITQAVSGKVDTSTFNTYSGSVETALSGKQDTLSAGTGIDITDNVISATGGGSITIDPSLDSGSTNPVANSAITTAIDSKQNVLGSGYYGGVSSTYMSSSEGTWDYAILKKFVNSGNTAGQNGDDKVYFTRINGKKLVSAYNPIYIPLPNLSLIETSAITTSISSSSTDAQVPSAKAVHDQLGGMKIVKLTESEYTALVTKDSNTLYVVVPDPSN